MAPRLSYSIPTHYIDLAVRFLRDDAGILMRNGYAESAYWTNILALELEQCVSQQVPIIE